MGLGQHHHARANTDKITIERVQAAYDFRRIHDKGHSKGILQTRNGQQRYLPLNEWDYLARAKIECLIADRMFNLKRDEKNYYRDNRKGNVKHLLW